MAGKQPVPPAKRKRKHQSGPRPTPRVATAADDDAEITEAAIPVDPDAAPTSGAPSRPSVSALSDGRRPRGYAAAAKAPAATVKTAKVSTSDGAGAPAKSAKPTRTANTAKPTKAPEVEASPTMSAEELSRERRLGWPVGLCGLAVTVLTIAAVPVAASGPKIVAPSGSDKALLLGAALAGHAQLTAMWLRVASVLLVIPVALFLWGVISRRNPRHLKVITVLGVVAFVIVAASTAVGFFEVRDAAHVYVASGARTTARASHVLSAERAKGPLRVADVGQLVGGLLFGLWISIISWETMRVGLLTRFLGMFGIGAGLTTVIGIAIGPALFIGWLASLSCLAVGYWPGGRPLAWDAGRAVSLDESDAAVMPRRSTTRR